MTFGQFISARRKSLRLSLQDVADRAALSKGGIWDMEQGNSANPSVSTICGLAVALDTPPDALAKIAIRDYMKKIKVEVTTTKRVKR